MDALPPDFSTLGRRVSHALQQSGYDPKSAAAALGCSRPAIDQWIEDKTKNIKNDLLFKLADLTRFNARWIATGEYPMIDVYSSDSRIKHILGVMEVLPEYARDEVVKEIDSIADLVYKATAAAQSKIGEVQKNEQKEQENGSV